MKYLVAGYLGMLSQPLNRNSAQEESEEGRVTPALLLMSGLSGTQVEDNVLSTGFGERVLSHVWLASPVSS